jgi:hypothetical protein
VGYASLLVPAGRLANTQALASEPGAPDGAVSNLHVSSAKVAELIDDARI